MILVSLTLLASGCSQREPENETERVGNETERVGSETERVENETKKIDNESRNLTKETEEVPQEIESVIEKSDRNIMQTLTDRNFVTLVELINVAGLEETLAEDGIYTVFAPADEAFAELPENAVPALKNNTQELRKVLTSHVVAGKILMEKDIENMASIKTLEGRELAVNVTANGIQIGGANITDADIVANNGVIHQIDKVLISPW